MNDVNSAARSFFVLSAIAELLTECHKHGCNWNYEIAAMMTEGVKPPKTEADLPQKTGGYTIHITIDPPPELKMVDTGAFAEIDRRRKELEERNERGARRTGGII